MNRLRIQFLINQMSRFSYITILRLVSWLKYSKLTNQPQSHEIIILNQFATSTVYESCTRQYHHGFRQRFACYEPSGRNVKIFRHPV
jgi:hypothetical protein